MKLELKKNSEYNDSVEQIVKDYITTIVLDEKGLIENESEYNLEDKGKSYIFESIQIANNRYSEKKYQILLDILSKRIVNKNQELIECNQTITSMHRQIIDMGEAISHVIIELETLYKKLGYSNSNVLRELKDSANIKS